MADEEIFTADQVFLELRLPPLALVSWLTEVASVVDVGVGEVDFHLVVVVFHPVAGLARDGGTPMVGISSRVGTFHEKEETATTGGVTSEVVMSEEATNAIAEVTNAMVEVTVATTLTAGSTEEETGTAIVVLTATTGTAASGTAGTGGRGILPAGSVNQSEDVVEMPPPQVLWKFEKRHEERRADRCHQNEALGVSLGFDFMSMEAESIVECWNKAGGAGRFFEVTCLVAFAEVTQKFTSKDKLHQRPLFFAGDTSTYF